MNEIAAVGLVPELAWLRDLYDTEPSRGAASESSSRAAATMSALVLACPLMPQSPSGDSELLVVAREAFHSWVAFVAEQLVEVGIEKDRAGGMAAIAVAGVEGALILRRVERGGAPLKAAAGQLQGLVAS